VVVVVVVVVVMVSGRRRRGGEVWSNAIAGRAVENLSIHLHHKLVVCSRLAGCWAWVELGGLAWLAGWLAG
jgi:hypothetical protein